jgi:acyl dehydratase
MGVPTRYVLHQGPVLWALGSGALTMLKQRMGAAASGAVAAPGPELRGSLSPRPRDLVRDYVKHVGGDPSAYKDELPPHLFPQWGFGLASRALEGLPYPIARVMNGGCRLEVNAPVPIDAPLRVSARLEDVDDDGRRAVLHTRIVTSTPSHDEALVAHMYAIVPLGSGKSNGDGRDAPKRKTKDKPRVPEGARELVRVRLGPNAGLDFAKLTGDFNPVHWVPGYARAFGFRNVILHGFSTMARAWEGLVRTHYAGDVRAIRSFDCRFTRPLVLPASVGVFADDAHGVFVGDAPMGPAYLVGTYGDDR